MLIEPTTRKEELFMQASDEEVLNVLRIHNDAAVSLTSRDIHMWRRRVKVPQDPVQPPDLRSSKLMPRTVMFNSCRRDAADVVDRERDRLDRVVNANILRLSAM